MSALSIQDVTQPVTPHWGSAQMKVSIPADMSTSVSASDSRANATADVSATHIETNTSGDVSGTLVSLHTDWTKLAITSIDGPPSGSNTMGHVVPSRDTYAIQNDVNWLANNPIHIDLTDSTDEETCATHLAAHEEGSTLATPAREQWMVLSVGWWVWRKT